MKYDLRVAKDEVKRKNRLRLLVDTPRQAASDECRVGLILVGSTPSWVVVYSISDVLFSGSGCCTVCLWCGCGTRVTDTPTIRPVAPAATLRGMVEIVSTNSSGRVMGLRA